MLGWGAGKVIIERLCISLPYVETFNSKVIKGFVPELRSRSMYICYEHYMYVSRISVSGYGTTSLNFSRELVTKALIQSREYSYITEHRQRFSEQSFDLRQCVQLHY